MKQRALLVALAVLVSSSSAHAHLVNTGLGPFYDGVTHFAVTPEALLPALALALLAGQNGARAGRLALFLLPGAWLFAALLGLAFPLRDNAPLATTVAFVALGALVAGQARMRAAWLGALAVLLGLVHGSLDGAAMAGARLGALGVVGSVSAAFVTVALAAALVVTLRAPWARIAVRVAGSWIVAIGLLLLGWSLRAA